MYRVNFFYIEVGRFILELLGNEYYKSANYLHMYAWCMRNSLSQVIFSNTRFIPFLFYYLWL